MEQPNFTVGIIGEGPTDHEVLKAIIRGYTGNKDINFSPLQPKKDTDPGSWGLVLRYCASSDFKGAFTNPDLIVVVQIDTDVFGTEHVPKEEAIERMDSMSVPQIVAAMREKLIAKMSVTFFTAVADRILFAIAVHETECWFLPAYFPSDEKKAGNPKSCIKHLNDQLAKTKKGFYIDGKDLNNYRELCKDFKKRKDILTYANMNESLGLFIQELDRLPIADEASEAL